MIDIDLNLERMKIFQTVRNEKSGNFGILNNLRAFNRKNYETFENRNVFKISEFLDVPKI